MTDKTDKEEEVEKIACVLRSFTKQTELGYFVIPLTDGLDSLTVIAGDICRAIEEPFYMDTGF